MAKREFLEDIIYTIDELFKNQIENKNAMINPHSGAEGYFNGDKNPYNKSGVNLEDFTTKSLHSLFKEISWDNLNFILDVREDWDREYFECDEAYYRNEKENYNTCEEEYKRLGEKIMELWKKPVFETCAWYQSYHYLPRTYWGIHILESCWINTAKKIYMFTARGSQNDALKSAFLLIFCHELFHYITDNTASILEVTMNKNDIYKNYTKNVYEKDYLNPGALEEALANRFLYGRYDFCKINKHLLYYMLKGGPKGYRDFDLYMGNNFWMGKRKLSNQIYYSDSKPKFELPLEQIFEMINAGIFSSGFKIPIWLHTKKGETSKIQFY